MHSRSGAWRDPAPRQPNRRELRTFELEAIQEEGGAVEIAPPAWRSKFAQTLRENRMTWYKAWKRCLLSRNGTYSVVDMLYSCTRNEVLPAMKKNAAEHLKAKDKTFAMAKKLRKLIVQLPELEASDLDNLLVSQALETCADILERDASFRGMFLDRNQVNRHQAVLPVIAVLKSALTYPEIFDLLEAAWYVTSGNTPPRVSEGSIRKYWDKVAERKKKTTRR